MRVKGWYLMLLAAVILPVDFLTLGNRRWFTTFGWSTSQRVGQLATGIFFLGLLVFLFGLIKTGYDFLSKNKERQKIRRQQEEEQGVRATGVEIGLRRLLAILLILSVIPLVVLTSFLGLIVGLPNLLLSLYLLLNRRYHLVFDGLLVFLGGLGYFFPIVGGSYFSLYKNLELSACPGLIDPRDNLVMTIVFGLGRYFLLAIPLFLLVGDVITRFKLSHKRWWAAISLVIICLVLFFLPHLYVPRVALGQATGGGTGGNDPSHFLAFNTQFIMAYDRARNVYEFTANMPNQDSNNPASITNICVDSKLIPITQENSMLQVDNGSISGGKITVAPGQTAIIKLVSQKPFYVITLFEGMFRYSNGYLK